MQADPLCHEPTRHACPKRLEPCFNFAVPHSGPWAAVTRSQGTAARGVRLTAASRCCESDDAQAVPC